MTKFRSFCFQWIVPPSVRLLLRSLQSYARVMFSYRRLLARNRALCNLHAGQRCFILGTGPSINKMDLKPLSNEICIALNSFHRHVDYSRLAPRYHLFAGLVTHPLIPEDAGDEYMRDLVRLTGSATLLLHAGDFERFHRAGYLVGRESYFFLYDSPMERLPEGKIDATHSLFQSFNVALMAIQVALYMGFKEIYLLGLDHDWILRYSERQSTHFYKPETCPLERRGMNDRDERKNMSWINLFSWCHDTWAKYEIVKAYATKNGVQIINMTVGGILDVFPRANFDSLFPYQADHPCRTDGKG